VRQYEGLFILDTVGTTEGVDDIIKAIGGLVDEAGGKVANEQKLDRRGFARIADKKNSGGFYVSLIFDMEPDALLGFKSALAKRKDVFREQITLMPIATG
tara:strand:+ start:254 stop:553 length:300 start_codon:yes stop_codon:yes gene_type:complete